MHKIYIVIIIIVLSVLCSIFLFGQTNTLKYQCIEGQENVASTPIDPNTINSEALQNISSVYNNKHLRVDEITTNKINILPIGSIIMWYGDISEIPDGWAFCDGKTINGVKTPDLKGRFILASEGNTKNSGAGSINLGNMVTSFAGKHSHKMQNCVEGTTGIATNYTYCNAESIAAEVDAHIHSTNITKGGLTLGQMYPIFHRLIFIMRIR